MVILLGLYVSSLETYSNTSETGASESSDSLQIRCVDEFGRVVSVGKVLLIMKKAEPLLLNIDKEVWVPLEYLKTVDCLLFESPGYKIKILPKDSLDSSLIQKGILAIFDIQERDTVLARERFEVSDYFLRIRGHLNPPGNKKIYVSSLWVPYSPKTVFLPEDFDCEIVNLKYERFFKALHRRLLVMIEEDTTHLPYVAYAKLEKETSVTKQYLIKQSIDLTKYDFNIISPKSKEAVYGSDIKFEIDKFSFDPKFGKIDFTIPEKDSTFFTILPGEQKQSKFVLKDAYHLLKKNKKYTFRASYFSYLANKEIIVKKGEFYYNSRPPDVFSLIKSNALKSKYRFSDTLFIFWYPSSDPDEEDTIKYSLVLYDERHRERMIIGDTTKETKAYVLIGPTKFERGKRYICSVRAVDSYGVSTISSDSHSFKVLGPKPKISLPQSSHISPLVIQFKYHHVVKDQSYERFINSIKTKTNFGNFSQIDFVFEQDSVLVNKLNLEIKFSLYSLVGVGLALEPSYQVIQNKFLTFITFSNLSGAMFGTGMGDQTNGFLKAKIGGSLSIGKSRNISFSGSWIPFYGTPYQTIYNEVKNFEASGWQIGVDLIIPDKVMPEFNLPLINWTVDPMRFPIEYKYSRITNTDGVEIKEHTVGIGYRF